MKAVLHRIVATLATLAAVFLTAGGSLNVR